MARVALYGRVSGHEQEKDETIQSQRFYLEQWAAENNHEIAGRYWDENVRSHIPVRDRPEGGRLLRDAARGKFEVVAIYRLGRWSRYTEVWVEGRSELQKCGVDLFCLNEDVRDETPSGKFSLGVRLLVNEYDRDLIAQNTLDGKYRRAHEGGYLGGVVPYGYRVAGDRRKTLEIDPAEAEIVRQMFRWLVEEKLSTRRITLRLNALGVPTPTLSAKAGQHRNQNGPTSGVWRPASVSVILTSPTYKGSGFYGRHSRAARDAVPIRLPAIVDEATWAAVQRQLAENRALSPRDHKRRYLLSGYVYCAHCKRSCYGRPSRGGRNIYYICPSKDVKVFDSTLPPCPLPYIRCERLEDDLWARLLPHILDSRGTVELLQQQLAESQGKESDLVTRSDDLRAKITEKGAARRRAVSNATDGLITREELREELERLQEQVEELERQLSEVDRLIASGADRERSLHDAEAWLKQWEHRMQEPFTWEKKRAAIEAFVSRIEVSQAEEKTVARYLFHFAPVSAASTMT